MPPRSAGICDTPWVLLALIARATDRALSRCAEDDPPRVVALRVAVAILRELQRTGVTLPRRSVPPPG